jgi:multimeric flavodoxin WrbA
MKIIGINGSPRGDQSRTRRLVQAVLDGATEAGAETELIDVSAYDLKYCTGCGVCYAQGECPLADDFEEIYQKILDADGIVLGSPVYIMSVTAQLKTLIDRMADAIHCQMLNGVYSVAVTTTGGGGHDEVIAYMQRVLNMLGSITIGGVGVALGGNPDALNGATLEAAALGVTLVDSIRTSRHYPEQEEILAKNREYFCALVSANKDVWVHEYEYWKELDLLLH